MTEATDIGEMLHAEHLHTLAVANAIEERIENNRNRPLDAAQPDDARFIDELIAAIDNEIHRHFRFEEEALFPLVNQAGLQDVTAMLVHEHATIRAMADELRSLAEAARCAALDARQWSSFRNLATDFVIAEMFHIQKEEMSVVRGLSMTIGVSASRELAARTRVLGTNTRPERRRRNARGQRSSGRVSGLNPAPLQIARRSRKKLAHRRPMPSLSICVRRKNRPAV